ncbi:hypothetical protein KK062_11170 [Fulvivirgaceae bacterium PWU5]|uniref:Uncharacterized protein n=1 Tax=Dawidia cretensis TaxID=2782350 RepID=A0AAP2DYJ4_9BACT|nr:hypothetical protein [Dawidia cretensis]MBT1708789.1 hypothetical protein [Dawidia cretensis]
MNKFGIIHIVLFFLLMLSYLFSSGQGDQVVTIKGETLTGTLKPLAFGPDKKIQVTSADKKKTTVPLLQVKYYTFKGDTYRPVKGPQGYTFMKVVKDGYVTLYAFQQENQTSYDGRFLVKKDGESTEIPNLSFKKIMTRFLDDCEEVSAKVENGMLSKKDLDVIIDEYNQCIEQRTQAREKAVATRVEAVKKISSWDVLEEKVKTYETFEGKESTLEMITEIKNKIARGEKVPNFLTSGLKSSITQPDLQEALNNAIKDLE